MTRLQKVAVFNIAMMIVAAGLVLILFQLTGSSFSLCGMMILAVLWFNRWMFKGKDGPKWDERENKIARRAALIGYWVFWMFFFMSAWMYATVIGRRIVVPLWCFTFVPVVGMYILLISMMLAILWLAREPIRKRNRLMVVGGIREINQNYWNFSGLWLYKTVEARFALWEDLDD